MADIKIYHKVTGEIFNEQSGHPHDKDPLTKERQREMLASMFPEIFYTVGMLVSEGHNAVFFPDVVEGKDVPVITKDRDGKDRKVLVRKKFVKLNKVPK